jgi:acyl carrier protein
MTHDEVLNWLCELFDEPTGNLKSETHRSQVAGWDSLGVLTLMAEMDEKFNITLSEADLLTLEKIGDIQRILAERGALTSV